MTTHARPPDPDEFFRPYRDALGPDWAATDALLHRWLDRHGVAPSARSFVERAGQDAATTHRRRADEVELSPNLPRLAPTPTPTTDDIVLPAATLDALAHAHGSGLWSPDLDPRARYAALYLWAQNGEAGVLCSLACTDGLARALERLGSGPRDEAILAAIRSATPDRYVHGAQFVTEIQGGSDAGANQVRAQPVQDGSYLLYGQKWFCSNATADHWLVTARPIGAPDGPRGVGLFLVPRHVDGRPNGHVVERLKDKAGTRALATAELRLDAARAWPLGPLRDGLKNMVGIVLTTSRVHNILASAGLLRAAAREATAYARVRTAFGRPIADQPLVAETLERLATAADRTQATAFATVDAWLAADAAQPDADEAAWARILISIAKAVTARRASRHLYDAMMVLGGNGIEERFSPLPRLWRDAAIFETWEGPYTLLLMQALDDLVRYVGPARADAFLHRHVGARAAERLSPSLRRVLERPTDATIVREWGMLAPLLLEHIEQAWLAGATHRVPA